MPLKILHPSSSSPHLSKLSYYLNWSCWSCHSVNHFPRILVSSPQIVSGPSINKEIALRLEECPSDIYIIVSQPGVNAVDFQDPFSAPHLRQKLSGEDRNIRSSLKVSDVIGKFDSTNLSRRVQEKCGASLVKVDASCTSATTGPEKVLLMGHQTDNILSSWLIFNTERIKGSCHQPWLPTPSKYKF